MHYILTSIYIYIYIIKKEFRTHGNYISIELDKILICCNSFYTDQKCQKLCVTQLAKIVFELQPDLKSEN